MSEKSKILQSPYFADVKNIEHKLADYQFNIM